MGPTSKQLSPYNVHICNQSKLIIASGEGVQRTQPKKKVKKERSEVAVLNVIEAVEQEKMPITYGIKTTEHSGQVWEAEAASRAGQQTNEQDD